MKMSYSIGERFFDDMSGVEPERVAALRANPFLWQEKTPFQEVGIVDGKVAGFNYIFPIGLLLDGKECGGATGSSLNVQEWARPSCVGLVLPTVGTDRAARDGVAVAASCSQMAIPVHQINGYKYFFMPRFIGLFKSRSVVETVLRNRGLARLASWIVDRALDGVSLILGGICRLRLRGVERASVCPGDADTLKQIAELIRQDEHRFSELHDERWLKWHLTQSFSKDGPNRMWTFRRGGRLLGFIMLKKRFHEQASHRGFRNVWLVSFGEWGCAKGAEALLKWMVLSGALLMRREGVDACELVTVDLGLKSFFRKVGWRQVGESNYGVKVWPKSPWFGMKRELQDAANWRLRPAMGDNGLS